ncbi:MAG: hypothetical protein V4611_02145 [Patescibacteria group bacterium]
MSTKQTIRNLIAGFLLVFGLVAIVLPTSAQAACGGVETSIITCGDSTTDNNGDGVVDEKDSGLWSILLLVINILTAGVGVVALAGIIYGAILYTSAGGNQEQVKKAIGVFTNVVIGVVAFAGMWALLNFLVPGGVF